MAFDQATRNRLQGFVSEARKLLSNEFTQQLQNTYGLDPNTGAIAALAELPSLSPYEQQTAKLLRETLDHYLAASHKADPYADADLVSDTLDRMVREQAFTVLNRLCALRMAEAREFIPESISKGYQSKGFQRYQRIADTALGETGLTYQVYLFSVFDELSLDLAVLFDRYSSQGRLFPSEAVLLELLDLINHAELEVLWAEDETIGWIYQYFNSKEERKKMRDESQAPRNSRELAVRNQFFTPRYVVEFLTDNTLGRIWYEMTKGQTALADSCQYLVRRPSEHFLEPDQQPPESESASDQELSQEELLQQPVYIEHRPLKDPRDIKMLDPACGSMHFGLYAFDLYETIYAETWELEEAAGGESSAQNAPSDDSKPEVQKSLHQSYADKEAFLADVPRLIIEHNIHGVDIDPRATQIAGLSLWLRAQKSWSQNEIQPVSRPQIQRSNIVCAEPMPGEKTLLNEFVSQVQPKVLGQLVEEIFDKMQLAGEAGTLLKIEEEIQSAIEEAKSQRDEQTLEVQGGLFGEDKWEVREGKRYYNIGDADDDFWGKAEHLILAELERYAETAGGEGSGQKRLFAADAARGFAFIDLCRNQFDVVLMNPPFGEGASSCMSYLSATYPRWSKNILCAFISRAHELSSNDGLYGAIFDRTVAIKSSYQDFRKEHLITQIRSVLDTGWGVLDANVETTTYVFSKNQQVDGTSVFVDLRDEPEITKSSKILQSINDIYNSSDNEAVYFSFNYAFLKLPNSVIAYSLQDFVKSAFIRNKTLGEEGWQARKGHDYVSFQHFRLFWERDVAKESLADSDFVRVYNGGKYSSFFAPLRDIVVYGENGSLVKENSSVYIRNRNYHFKQGVGYGKRGDVIDAHLLPKGFSFTSEGLAATDLTEEDSLLLLGYLNSIAGQFILNTYSGQHKQVGYVNLLPFPSFDPDDKRKIIDNVKAAIQIKKKWLMMDETTPFFDLNLFLNEILKHAPASTLSELAASDNEEYRQIVISNDAFFRKAFDCSDSNEVDDFSRMRPDDFPWPEDYKHAEKDELQEIVPIMGASILFGALFGRWRRTDGEIIPIGIFDPPPDLDHECAKNASAKLPTTSSVDILGLESTDKINVQERYEELTRTLWAIDGVNVFKNIAGPMECSDIIDCFTPTKFFPFHFQQYSKSRRVAPIYWPLETESGAYVLWIYFHKINQQTLFRCVNDFVDPRLTVVQEDLAALRRSANRSVEDERDLGRMLELESELKSFRDELLHVSKYWNPNLDDGVQITAAPLWKLVRYRPWQEKLKKTWKELELGQLDWSKMARNIWPDRVFKKCHRDRSIAITHNVEFDLWEEVEVPAARGNGTKLVWQPKEMSEAELDAYIQQKMGEV